MIIKYELTTIKDIYEKIPADKIREAMGEITELMIDCKMIEGVLSEAVKHTTVRVCDIATKFPEQVVWVDDGLNSIEINASVNNVPVVKLKRKV
ncbi:MAG: hypothetical protein QM500_18230 [Methylococcales bacterium]